MKIINIKLILLAFLSYFSTAVFSQKEERKQLKTGNEEYEQKKYTESEIAYRKALQINARSTDAAYNLGNALYKQNKLPEAMEQFQALITGGEKDKLKLASAWHNAGNILLNTKEYAKSIEAYKQALRTNPSDDETRYNLALAQKMLKDQEQENQNKDKKKEQDQKDQKQEEKDKQEEKKEQDQKDQKQDQQPQQPQMSKDNAQQILDAMLQNEKNTQDKVKEMQVKQQQRKKTDKEW